VFQTKLLEKKKDLGIINQKECFGCHLTTREPLSDCNIRSPCTVVLKVIRMSVQLSACNLASALKLADRLLFQIQYEEFSLNYWAVPIFRHSDP
jgi:hypothetical protein